MGASAFGISATTRSLPRTTERPVRKPRSNSVVRKRCVLYPARLERGKRGDECSVLSVTLWSNLSTEAAHVSAGYDSTGQNHGRKSVVRGLLKILFDLGTENNNTPVGISGHLSY